MAAVPSSSGSFVYSPVGADVTATKPSTGRTKKKVVRKSMSEQVMEQRRTRLTEGEDADIAAELLSNKRLSIDSTSTFFSDVPSSPSVSEVSVDMSSDLYNNNDPESRRQLHLACEQNRRRNIKDGFDELKNALNCEGQKVTKANVLSKAVNFVYSVRKQKEFLVTEIHRLRSELETVRSSCTCHAAHNITYTPACLPGENPSKMMPIQPRIEEPKANAFDPTAMMQWNRGHQYLVEQQQQQQETPIKVEPEQDAWVEPFRRRNSQKRSTSGASLADGWDKIYTPDGKMFFINKLTGESSWTDPRMKGSFEEPEMCSMVQDEELPQGWEQRKTPEGLPYFIDHNSKQITWIDPRPNQNNWDTNMPMLNICSSLLPDISSKYEDTCMGDDEGYGSAPQSLHRQDCEFMENIPTYDSLFGITQ